MFNQKKVPVPSLFKKNSYQESENNEKELDQVPIYQFSEIQEDQLQEDDTNRVAQDKSTKLIIGQTIIIEREIENNVKGEPKITNMTEMQVYHYPEETKNIYKNIFSALQNFIKDHFPELKNSPEIKKFLSTKPNQQSKTRFFDFYKSSAKLKVIVQFFLLNKCWARYLLKNNKCDLEPYFRLTQEMM